MPQRQRLIRSREEREGNAEENGTASAVSRAPTRANIRTWIHERAVSRLRELLWEGQGTRLLQETTANPPVRKFLNAVPQVLAAIKEVHALAVANGADQLKKTTAPPAPRELLLSKDSNGLTPLHKAAGLGNSESVRVILGRVLESVRAKDDQGKLPLHYAAYAVGSSGVREENKEVTYHLLVEAGSDESQTDNQPVDKQEVSEGELDGRREGAGAEAATSLLPPHTSPPPSPPPRPPSPKEVLPTQSTPPPESLPPDANRAHSSPTQPASPSDSSEDGDFPPPTEAEDNKVSINDDAQDPGINDSKEELNALVTYTDEGSVPAEQRRESINGMMPVGVTDVKKVVTEREGNVTGNATREANTEYKEHEDEELTRAAGDGDVELLLTVVLSGEGSRLIGLTSNDPKTQSFLYDVPMYMEIIREIHEAASNGSVKDIQAKLDHRKYAIAKEPTIGATPLHSAVLGASRAKLRLKRESEGAEAMVRYLGGRFPESINQKDRYNRTPLHYATGLPDEEARFRLYEVLRQLGADSTIEDSLGHTPAYYLANPKDFPHEDLLPYMEYIRWEKKKGTMMGSSVEEEGPNKTEAVTPPGSSIDSPEGSLSRSSSNSHEPTQPMDIPVLWTEEGQYLAKSLGEPLVKGLTEVTQRRPKDPVGFLADYLKTFSKAHDATAVTLREDLKRMDREGHLENLGEPFGTGPISDVFRGKEERDEHGQTAIHKAAGRSGSRGSLLHLIRQTGSNVALRDELYRTPRDVAARAGLQQNVRDIDTWIVTLATAGTLQDDQNGTEMLEAEAAMSMLKSFLLEGYDHILDATSSYGSGESQGTSRSKKRNLLDLMKESSYLPIISLLKTIPTFEERREWLHSAIRAGSLEHTQEILLATSESFDDSNSLRDSPPPSIPTSPSLPNSPEEDKQEKNVAQNQEWPTIEFNLSEKFPPILGPAALAVAKNRRGRCSTHIAVLCQRLEIAKFIAQHFPQTLHVGDNLERTPLHYAMGIESVDSFSQVLIQAGAKRIVKDLKGKQPSYYFINNSDIQKLLDEETFRE